METAGGTAVTAGDGHGADATSRVPTGVRGDDDGVLAVIVAGSRLTAVCAMLSGLHQEYPEAAVRSDGEGNLVVWETATAARSERDEKCNDCLKSGLPGIRQCERCGDAQAAAILGREG